MCCNFKFREQTGLSTLSVVALLGASHRICIRPCRARVGHKKTDSGGKEAHDQVENVIGCIHMHQSKQPLIELEGRNETCNPYQEVDDAEDLIEAARPAGKRCR